MDELAAVLVVESPVVKIKPEIRNEKAYFDFTVEAHAGVNELHLKLSEKELFTPPDNV